MDEVLQSFTLHVKLFLHFPEFLCSQINQGTKKERIITERSEEGHYQGRKGARKEGNISGVSLMLNV